MTKITRLMAALGAALFFCASAVAENDTHLFAVADIQVVGLQRLPVERVLINLPVHTGDQVDGEQIAAAAKALFATGDFDDVQIAREGDELVVIVTERPAIARIEIEGNKSIEEKNLREGLKDAGLAEGETFRRVTLEILTGELQRQYVGQGRYGATIETEVTPLPRNRVALDIRIHERGAARIRDINIIGNTHFSDAELADQISLQPRSLWSGIRGKDKYSRERLSSDLESLRSWYLDHGYIHFSVESTQVAVTPDKREVYITINISEGDQYRVGEVKLAGTLVIPEEQLVPLVVIGEGDVFSQQRVTLTKELLSRRLGNEGYTFARINEILEPDEESQIVDLVFFIDPGRRTYVRRINFTGNLKTQDEVLRRELRQFEGAPANTALVDLSRQRLQRLGFFSRVEVETPRVVGSDDLIDVEYSVEEQPSGSIGANIGYSDASGVLFGASVSQNNFMGTGNKVSFAINKSDVRESYNFSHMNPYFTLDGVSRGFSLYFSKIALSKAAVAPYAADRPGLNMNFGYPISEYSRLGFGGGFDQIELKTGEFVAVDIHDFLESEGYTFDLFKLDMSWQKNTLNRGVLADRGWSQSLGMEVAAPGSDYGFYKISWSGQRYFPITRSWVLRTRGDLGYGDGYGDDHVVPFFEHYFAGGIGSVRGYRARSLGARSPAITFIEEGLEDPSPDNVGGNFLVEGSMELIFPTPFAPQSRSLRTFLFVDGGQVFQTELEDNLFPFDSEELRYSYGVGLTWLTAIGPLSFNFARPINKQRGDDTEFFQFSLGQVF